MVRPERFELSPVARLVPKTSVSTVPPWARVNLLFLKEAITSKVIISLIAVIFGIYIVKKGSKIKLV